MTNIKATSKISKMKRYIIAKSGGSTCYCDDKEKIILEQEETDEANEYSRSFTGEFHGDLNIFSKFVTFDDSFDTDMEPEVFKTY